MGSVPVVAKGVGEGRLTIGFCPILERVSRRELCCSPSSPLRVLRRENFESHFILLSTKSQNFIHFH